MTTKLLRFKVENFRSVENSCWIEISDVNCLVGTNESGKTNLLLALWKMKPANKELITPLEDYPRKKYADYKDTLGDEIFITCEFELSHSTTHKLEKLTGWNQSFFKKMLLARSYKGSYSYNYLSDSAPSFSKEKLISLLDSIDEKESEEEDSLTSVRATLASYHDYLNEKDLSAIYNNLKEKFDEGEISKIINPLLKTIDKKYISLDKETFFALYQALPTFVYYSDYGNLDSEIYLPHVIKNFERTDLGEKERSKARSLKVLFEFVNLSPEEILELGKEALPIRVITNTVYHHNQTQKTSETLEEPQEDDIETVKANKKEREVLLQSASTKLTSKFKEWWKQGNYRFRFQADGNHFRIWVSDEIRTEEVELEGRSRGLQWFFSFFLVFLVESKDSHENCILLLDEPGISLHPIAQSDLLTFFQSLSESNQLIYTTHSPFLVDSDNLGDVHAVYVSKEGKTLVSSDLRANKAIAEKSIYPIHAAIGLTVSETMLIGCQPVLVEGPSDQIYFSLIKLYMIKNGFYKNSKELVFIPTGGIRGMSPIISILSGRENDLPFVILDSDKSGKDKYNNLKGDLYADSQKKLIAVDKYLNAGNWEIEDLMPTAELARLFSRTYRMKETEDEFEDIFDSKLPILPQMEKYAQDNQYALAQGWKVELAKDLRSSFKKLSDKGIDDNIVKIWRAIFDQLTGNQPSNLT
ncbi:AAA family ATPase [uncultured Thiothrix sp.]|uniref:AAA family ATPase n=1 Tax=uncultured Thiothrix sp. TaxID=223185 RepID=UPI00262E3ECF|nr:AAA family ATPase [uncultured Thiothrix sp.]